MTVPVGKSMILPTPHKTNFLVEPGDLIVLYPTVPGAFGNKGQGLLLWEATMSEDGFTVARMENGTHCGSVMLETGRLAMFVDARRYIKTSPFSCVREVGHPASDEPVGTKVGTVLQVLVDEKLGWIFLASYTYTRPYADKTW